MSVCENLFVAANVYFSGGGENVAAAALELWQLLPKLPLTRLFFLFLLLLCFKAIVPFSGQWSPVYTVRRGRHQGRSGTHVQANGRPLSDVKEAASRHEAS